MADLFGGAAPYYAKYRPGHGDSAIERLAKTFGADGTVLDLGCGPGTVAIPLARGVREVLAVDPDEEMLETGRRLAARARNIRWLRGDSTTLRELPAFGDVDATTYEHRLTYDLDAVIGLQLSYSYSAPARLGDRLEPFKEAARKALLALNPAGRWEYTEVTEVLIARRPNG
ncbi:class I SAM-dependent methyltransferase [Nonomuraea sp. NPDC005650]|uniref:class I SAM-dependent methyltransferase n=1 Tax=Nonomuraea sp. NPDC005650 TaxID=3157045 RepID=UPI0033BC695F